jgi:hypothetical protein
MRFALTPRFLPHACLRHNHVRRYDPPSTCTPNATSLAVYTSWVSAMVTELIVRRGLTNANTIIGFTEPLQYTSGNIPPGYTQNSWYVATLTALHAQLQADGVRHLVRIMGPNDGGFDSPEVQQVRAMCAASGANVCVVNAPTQHRRRPVVYCSLVVHDHLLPRCANPGGTRRTSSTWWTT